MINHEVFYSNNKFNQMSKKNQSKFKKIDSYIQEENIKFYGVWENELESDGYISFFRLENTDIEILRIQPTKHYLNIEVNWSIVNDKPPEKKNHVYFKIDDHFTQKDDFIIELKMIYSWYINHVYKLEKNNI